MLHNVSLKLPSCALQVFLYIVCNIFIPEVICIIAYDSHITKKMKIISDWAISKVWTIKDQFEGKKIIFFCSHDYSKHTFPFNQINAKQKDII